MARSLRCHVLTRRSPGSITSGTTFFNTTSRKWNPPPSMRERVGWVEPKKPRLQRGFFGETHHGSRRKIWMMGFAITHEERVIALPILRSSELQNIEPDPAVDQIDQSPVVECHVV